ncbi:MAG: energy transducer TonB [Bacteroidales bacterium]
MNMMNRSLKVILCFLIFAVDLSAQEPFSITSYLSGLEYRKTPVTVTKRFKSNPIPNEQITPDIDTFMVASLYRDIQKKEKISTEKSFRVLYKVQIENSTNNLYLFEFGNPESFRRQMLCIVSPEGQVLDSLEAGVFYGPNLAVKQHSLRSNKQLVVHELFSFNNEGDNLDDLKSFRGGRFDVFYEITNNKIKPRGSNSYYSDIYTRSFLDNRFYDIWEGEEIRCKLTDMQPRRLRMIQFADPVLPLDAHDKAPVFPGGELELLKYLNMTTSSLSKNRGHMSPEKVIVSFVIDEDGYAVNPVVVDNTKDKAIIRIALQTVNQMPRWTPAKRKGKPVAVKYTLPVHIRGY